MRIRTMHPEDLGFTALCTENEGWRSETRAAFEAGLAHDPGSCLIAEEDGPATGQAKGLPATDASVARSAGCRLGICLGTSSGRHAFIGELIVVPQARGRRLASR